MRFFKFTHSFIMKKIIFLSILNVAIITACNVSEKTKKVIIQDKYSMEISDMLTEAKGLSDEPHYNIKTYIESYTLS